MVAVAVVVAATEAEIDSVSPQMRQLIYDDKMLTRFDVYFMETFVFWFYNFVLSTDRRINLSFQKRNVIRFGLV